MSEKLFALETKAEEENYEINEKRRNQRKKPTPFFDLFEAVIAIFDFVNAVLEFRFALIVCVIDIFEFVAAELDWEVDLIDLAGDL